MSIYAGTEGYLDDIPADDVRRFEAELLDYMRTRKADLMQGIVNNGALPEGDTLAQAVADFKSGFRPTSAGE